MSLNRFNKADLPHCEEITRDACIASFLTDEGLCDITLKGKDGVSVNANRFWLAARSRVFRSMLLGEFSEAKKDVIPLGYNGCVLKALVEYIVTDRALVLENEGQESDGELVSLMAAAMFFELPGLCEKLLITFPVHCESNLHPQLPFWRLAKKKGQLFQLS
ncbi:expressed unknown protein [Seminavis robusta]|uniref:BTB domain-containing protein n=1 Tax=Seminavis robusta TaxID=568900 RepID=A0A9N8ERN5_9STRA|nr:expressed unknown protein [Seminavis robusta]|eukprot:Sro1466_g275060.1 n/a (162) ;mRNA; r:15593-16078